MEPILIVAFSAFLVATVFFFVFRHVNPVMPFFYSNAIIQSRSRNIIGKKKLSELSESRTVHELISHLEASDYLGEENIKTDLKGFHSLIEKSFVESIVDLKEISPKRVSRILDAYLMLWEVKMIKAVYRSRFSGADANEWILFPVGSITTDLLDRMNQATDIKRLRGLFSKTVYSGIMKKEYKSLEEFESEIDRFAFENLLEETKSTRMHDSKLICEMINTKIDVMNIMALMKAVSRKVPAEKRSNLLIINDSGLSKLHSELIKAGKIEDIAKLCKGTLFEDSLMKALAGYEKDKSLYHFEKELRKLYKNFVQERELSHSIGPYPLFVYLAKKENEFHNLLSISKGIHAKMGRAEIMEMVT
ncbi:V-type ATPase subunit [Candidatus Woesearchaeota archaeon]|nr:V-type ATPase subunit [Candidatus Woesearchaeota archaeon]